MRDNFDKIPMNVVNTGNQISQCRKKSISDKNNTGKNKLYTYCCVLNQAIRENSEGLLINE